MHAGICGLGVFLLLIGYSTSAPATPALKMYITIHTFVKHTFVNIHFFYEYDKISLSQNKNRDSVRTFVRTLCKCVSVNQTRIIKRKNFYFLYGVRKNMRKCVSVNQTRIIKRQKLLLLN